MKRFHLVLIAVVTLALSVAQAFAAPKKGAANKPAPKATVTMPNDWAYVSNFMSYDVGTLQMTGKTATDTTYSIGTLRLTGHAIGATTYSIGTLSMTGKQEP